MTENIIVDKVVILYEQINQVQMVLMSASNILSYSDDLISKDYIQNYFDLIEKQLVAMKEELHLIAINSCSAGGSETRPT